MFKVGDLVERISDSVYDEPYYAVGRQFYVASIIDNGLRVTDYDGIQHGVVNIKLIKAAATSTPPFLKEKTVTEFLPGVYGRISVVKPPETTLAFYVGTTNSFGKSSFENYLDSKELREAAILFNQLADYLDG